MTNTSVQFLNSTTDFLSPLQSEDCSNYFGFIFCVTIMALCFLVGTPAHLWCLWLYFCTERKIKDTQVFYLNHIVMDIIYCIESGLEILTMVFFYNKILWRVLYFFFGLSLIGKTLFQMCICIEQYLAVIHPVTFLRYKDIKYRIAAAVVAWLVAFAYSAYEVYAMTFPDFISIFVFLIALAVISFCCMSVLCVLKHPGPGDTHITKQTRRNGGNQHKRNAFNTIFSALLLILLTYLPQALLIVFTGIQIDQYLYHCNIVLIMISLNMIGVIITPLLKLYKERQKNSKVN